MARSPHEQPAAIERCGAHCGVTVFDASWERRRRQLVAGFKIDPETPDLLESRIGGVYHNGEVARELLPLVVVALGNILWVCQLDWRQNASS